MQEPLTTGVASEVWLSTVKPWTERITELVEGYKDVWNK